MQTHTDLTLASMLQTQSINAPDLIALSAPERSSLSYQALYIQVIAFISQLRSLGIQRQDRVAVVVENGPAAAAVFLAIASGATCTPLNPNYKASEYEFYLSDLSAKALIVQSDMGEPARRIASQLGILVIDLVPNLAGAAGSFTLSGDERLKDIQAEDSDTIDFSKSHETALILHTSGTTSRPKMVPLTHQNLCTSAQNVSASLGLKKSDRGLNVMPLFHIHGLVGALLSSISAGADTVCTPGFYAPKFLSWLAAHQPTWYSAVPTMHQQVLSQMVAQQDVEKAIASIRFIRSSSAPLPPQVMAELERSFEVPVIEAYGMTEAAHQMASNPLPPRHRKPGSVGLAAGPDVEIMNEQGRLLTNGEVGEIVIRGDSVTKGYENNPEANAKAFASGWFRTGDLGYVDSEGYLFLKGRIKEIINRGGEKISPREVDEVLLAHPAVAQVVTFAAPHTLLGEDIAAAVVLNENATASEQALKAFAAKKLADYKVPRVVIFLDEIPQGPTGKRQRIGLAEKLGLTTSDPTAHRAPYAAARTATEAALSRIWTEVLGVSAIGVHDNFFQLNGDSLLATQVINRVRATLQAELSYLIFFQQPTIENMAGSIDELQAAQLQHSEAEDTEVAALLAEIEALSEADVQQLLS